MTWEKLEQNLEIMQKVWSLKLSNAYNPGRTLNSYISVKVFS